MRAQQTGLPVGTLPFCIASAAMMFVQGKVPGFTVVVLRSVATAEQHLFAHRNHAFTSFVAKAAQAETSTTGSVQRRPSFSSGGGRRLSHSQLFANPMHTTMAPNSDTRARRFSFSRLAAVT